MMLAAMQLMLARQGGGMSCSQGMRGAVRYSIRPQMVKLMMAMEVV